MAYQLQTSSGPFTIDLPPKPTEDDLQKMKSFMNWAYRQAGGSPPKRRFYHVKEAIDGSYYKRGS